VSRGGRILAAVAILLGLGASGLMCQRVGERGRFAVPYSSYGAGPEGARALYLLASEIGARPTPWARDLSGLPERGMLVALGGCDNLMARRVTRYEREALEAWVSEGGVLLVAGADDYLWPELGVEMSRGSGECDPDVGLAGIIARAERGDLPEEEDEPEEGEDPVEPPIPPTFEDDPMAAFDELTEEEGLPPPMWATSGGGALSGMGSVPMRRPAVIHVVDDAAATTLLRLPRGPAAVAVRHGEGTVIAVASANPFQNREIESADGGVLFARLRSAYAPEGPVVFDEFHLGVGERRSLTHYVRDIDGAPVALQGLIVIAFLLWRFGTRFGDTRTEPAPPPAGTASYVTAIGTLFRKSRDPGGAIGLLARHGLSRVADHYHQPSTDSEALATRLEERGRVTQAAAVRELGAIARNTATGPRELVARARRIDDCARRATLEVTGGAVPAAPTKRDGDT